jgi:hypothetical protein
MLGSRKTPTATLPEERHCEVSLLKEKTNPPSEYFFQVSNPAEFDILGQTYVKEFSAGVRSFGITSTDYKASQQKTVLALACYFDHRFHCRILVVSDSLNNGTFAQVVEGSKKQSSSQGPELHYLKQDFHFVDQKLIDMMLTPQGSGPHGVSEFLNGYDVIFWDTPTLSNITGSKLHHSPSSKYIESLTIIVSQSVNNSKDVNELKNYFSSFGVDVRGVVFDKVQSLCRPTKKGWRLFVS